MATKTGLISAVNGFITSIVNIVKHRNSMLEVINEFYSTVSTEVKTSLADTTPNTTPNGSNHFYNLKMVKQGRVVSVSGNLSHNIGWIVAFESWFDINAGEFAHDANQIDFYGVSESSGNPVKMSLIGQTLKVTSPIANGEVVTFNFQYFTLD